MTANHRADTLPREEPAQDENTFRLRVPPPRRPEPAGPPGGRARGRSRSRVRRRRRTRRRAVGLAAAVLALGALTAVLAGRPWQDADAPARAVPVEAIGSPSAEPAPPPLPSASASSPSSPPPTRAAEDPPPKAEDVPASGPGTFTVARAGVTASGSGSAYRVEVEDGIGVDPDRAAEEVAAILADRRGWSHGGERSFRQVADRSAGLVIRIATPATTDRICGSYGLNTRGEVNCRGGEEVMVNLKRWLLGSPRFDGPVSGYRALIINHEVGHWLGRGHETCPGPGRPAPAMMQQIDGLKGCVANAWPYDRRGTYLGGPKVP
ncbi:hypothetical protein EES43_16920 [Streptomyces sp. ADI96-02]|uniref:DUF3152 domain-containing protein n=1 Tax=unclassified Streptomyces TaxID=2593676 RepID=UPI000FBB960D|nr:DUF3152 domain-containing protein [Streptomyces sp. ADI96-02]RPK60647.1 hypothetical protein EES43_16920 [Streptomyces sp. ADI96-02]